jgi:large subunit ribosomal protein L25
MSKSTNIKAESRDLSLSGKQLRAAGKIPATIYGHGFDSVSIQIDLKAFLNAYKGDKTSIYELSVDKESYSALVKNVQANSVNDNILNIEFYRIKTDEKLKIAVPVVIVGEPKVAKSDGILWNPLSEIEVECLPMNIPTNIQVDVSGLENLDDAITVGDIKLPTGVTAISAVDTLVARINAVAEAVTEEAPATEETAGLVQS